MSGGEPEEVRLAPESIEALAAALADALGGEGCGEGWARSAEAEEPQMISAEEVSRRWGVGRRWVYDHAERLGARRLGEGSRPRLRFDPAEVAERLGAPRPKGVGPDRTRLTAMRANPHSDSLSG
ncbi:MAG: hypothetical protein QM729_06940 [Solirubrobacterales bacterium]